MKVIFLDIDGVLNGYNKWNLLGWNIIRKTNCEPLMSLYKRISDPFTIHENKVKRLAKIIRKTNAVVVMSSSWRHGWWGRPYDKLYSDQKRLTDLFNKYNIDVFDITPTDKSGERGKEIKQWLDNHKDVSNFIILDDEDFDMGIFKNSDKLIKTSENNSNFNNYENSGLKNKHVRRAIKILNFY